MTITVQVPRNTYTANGVQDTFAFTYRILANADMRVFVDSSLQQEGVDYNLVGVTELGGDVVFVNVPSLDTNIILARKTPESQAVVYSPFDPFPAKTHENALDKLTMLIQEAQDALENITGVGLPLDPTGVFWTALSKQIKNISNPVDNTDAANKAYVDSVGGSGFDPESFQTITGQWTYTQPILGVTSGNLVAADLAGYTRNALPEIITDTWTFTDGAGSQRKVGARNPRERLVIVADTPIQADEGAILRVTAPIADVSLVPMEPQTVFTILAKAAGFNLLENGVTITWYDGSDNAGAKVGDRVIAKWASIQIQYESANEVSLWGNGIT